MHVLFVYIVRLVDGSLYNEGRIEVYYNGEWGTVCDHGWSEHNTKIVCMELGVGVFGILGNFGPGTGRAFLDNVICSDDDKTLASCGHYGVGITPFCSHSTDVGVKCFGMTKLDKHYITYYFLVCCVRFANVFSSNIQFIFAAVTYSHTHHVCMINCMIYAGNYVYTYIMIM